MAAAATYVGAAMERGTRLKGGYREHVTNAWLRDGLMVDVVAESCEQLVS